MKQVSVSLLMLLYAASTPAQEPRVSLTFVADKQEYAPAADEAQRTWVAEGARMIQAMEATSGLRFQEKAIRVIIHAAPSVSDAPIPTSPMKLNVRYQLPMSLLHELGGCHRSSESVLF